MKYNEIPVLTNERHNADLPNPHDILKIGDLIKLPILALHGSPCDYVKDGKFTGYPKGSILSPGHSGDYTCINKNESHHLGECSIELFEDDVFKLYRIEPEEQYYDGSMHIFFTYEAHCSRINQNVRFKMSSGWTNGLSQVILMREVK